MAKGKSGLHWTEEQLAAHRAKVPAAVEIPRFEVRPKGAPATAVAPAPSGKEKMQALGRLRDGAMNKTEARYAEHLRLQQHLGAIVWYKFEAIKLRLADSTFLTVDFAVLAADGRLQLHDVKGARAIYADDAKVKMKVAAETFPFQFFVAYPKKVKDGGGWDVEEV